jgi:hypothetical protein
MTTPLLPCPLCGTVAELTDEIEGHGDRWHYVQCLNHYTCGLRTDECCSRDIAIGRWNTRPNGEAGTKPSRSIGAIIGELELRAQRDEARREASELRAKVTEAWIPCAERMPAPMTYVLVTDGEEVREDRWYPWQTIDGKGLLPSDPRRDPAKEVPTWSRYTNATHWMPLPQPPAMGKANNGSAK